MRQSGILYVFVSLSVRQSGILYVLVSLGGILCIFVSLNVGQSGILYVFMSLSEMVSLSMRQKWNFKTFLIPSLRQSGFFKVFYSDCEAKWNLYVLVSLGGVFLFL